MGYWYTSPRSKHYLERLYCCSEKQKKWKIPPLQASSRCQRVKGIGEFCHRFKHSKYVSSIFYFKIPIGVMQAILQEDCYVKNGLLSHRERQEVSKISPVCILRKGALVLHHTIQTFKQFKGVHYMSWTVMKSIQICDSTWLPKIVLHRYTEIF